MTEAAPAVTVQAYLAMHLLWAAGTAAAIALSGLIAGVLGAAHQTLGDNVVIAQRRLIGQTALAIALVIATSAVAPATLFVRIPSAVLVLAIVLAAALSVFEPRAFHVGFALAAGTWFGALLLSLAGWIALFGVEVPVRLGTLFWIVFVCAMPGGLVLGEAIHKGATTGAAAMQAAYRMAAVVSARLAPLRNRLLKYSLSVLALGLVAAALTTASSWGPETLGRTIVMVGAAPFLCLLFIVLVIWAGGICTRFVVYWSVRSLIASARLSGLFRRLSLPLWILMFYRRSICDTCLRWSDPLKSSYVAGARTCELCGGTISRGPRGRVVVLVGEQAVPDHLPGRVFVRRASQVVASGTAVDVTHVRLVARDLLAREFEQLTMFLLNRKPSHGLRAVRVFPLDGLQAVPVTVRNRVDNYFSWTDDDPAADA